jgi:hypothetical protein
MSMAMALKRTYEGVASMHGFRAAFSSWANAVDPKNYFVVERCLSHVIDGDNKVARAYNRNNLDAEAAALWAAWAAAVYGGAG